MPMCSVMSIILYFCQVVLDLIVYRECGVPRVTPNVVYGPYGGWGKRGPVPFANHCL